MSSSTSYQVDANIRDRFLSIIRRTRVHEREANFIHLNSLWFEADTRKDFSRAISDFLASLPHRSAESVFLYPEGLLSSFGILPIVSIAANELGHRLVIWREIGDIVTTTPRLFPEFPPLPRGLSCIVLQDVVSKGTTLRKMHKLIRESGWTIIYYVAVVEIESGENEIEESIQECQPALSQQFRYVYLISDSDLRSL